MNPASMKPPGPQSPKFTEAKMLICDFSCPRCQCHELARSHRRGIDWLMSYIGLRPARCLACFKRFYLRDWLVKGQR